MYVRMRHEGNTVEENNGYVVFKLNGSTDQLRNRMVVTMPDPHPLSTAAFMDRYLKTT
jgi:hypothetical protein